MFCQQNNFLTKLIVLLLLAISINFAYAASKTKAKPQTIDIKARYLLLDEKKGINKYQGNVYFKKGTLAIKANTITLYYDGEKLTKVLIYGSPADVQHYPDNEAKVHSQAKKMEYLVAEDRLTLKGQAFVDQGDDHFSGETIEYDTRQRTITAAGNQSKAVNTKNSKNSQPNRRVHVIIGPRKETKN
jgi:lipopolysaccharide export system protein LptA